MPIASAVMSKKSVRSLNWNLAREPVAVVTSVAAISNSHSIATLPPATIGMQTFTAYEVSDSLDFDDGEGWLCFRWKDPIYGYDELEINLEGHCSRRMPIHSGNGPPEFVSVERDRVVLRFSSALAKKLDLDENIEIIVSLSDDELNRLRTVAACLNEPGFGSPTDES